MRLDYDLRVYPGLDVCEGLISAFRTMSFYKASEDHAEI